MPPDMAVSYVFGQLTLLFSLTTAFTPLWWKYLW